MMDEVVDQLETTDIDPEKEEENEEEKGEENEEEKEQVTSFERLYKNWAKLGNQEERRKSTLATQKKNRNQKLDISRGILELVGSVEKSDAYRYDRYRPTIHVAGFTRTSLTYKNVLMFSEWLVEKPEDFESNWLVVPCPKGVRTLVVAYQGNTRFFNKFGMFKMACRTALPAGNPQDPCPRDQYVVLDCFHVVSLNKMYVLDVLAWKNQPMTNGETEFRHYWIKSQMDEIPDLKTLSKKNTVIFELLPKVPCAPDSFNEFMMKVPHFENSKPNLDGLLFYHQNAHYISGVTPLVGWLYPYMVNEVLGPEITVNEAYTLKKPKDYVNQAEFIQKFDAKHNKRKRRAKPKEETMDTSSEVNITQDEAQNEPGTASETTEVKMDAEVISESSTNETAECLPMDSDREMKSETSIMETTESSEMDADKDIKSEMGTNETSETVAMNAEKETELKSEMCTDDVPTSS